MTKRPILFFHSVDSNNINAQSNNVKAILAHWDNIEFPAETFYFDRPDPVIAKNPNVRLWKLPRNRLWKIFALRLISREYSAVCYPGLAPDFDDHWRQLRKFLGFKEVVISTLEGFPADQRQSEQIETRLGQILGHKVFCQPISPSLMAPLNRLKAGSNMIITISDFLEKISKHTWPNVPTNVVPLGVHLDIFNDNGRLSHADRNRPRVVSAGNCSKHKRPELFLQLAIENPDADFIWCGEGHQRTELNERAESLGMQNIKFPGSVDRETLAETFRQSDLFVLPSASEGLPKVTQEAAACGLPVVCMRYYQPFSVVHGVNGFQAVDDLEFLFHTKTLIKNCQLRASMGAASAQMAKDWDWSKLAIRWQAVICDAAANQQKM